MKPKNKNVGSDRLKAVTRLLMGGDRFRFEDRFYRFKNRKRAFPWAMEALQDVLSMAEFWDLMDELLKYTVKLKQRIVFEISWPEFS